ncbi:MAG TPA: hypothetical protein VGK93_05635 [Candidatus Eisenbacteria bacterium]|jgi:hypothetical protein
MKPERNQVFAQGLAAGLLGYATVAVFFAIVNWFTGRSAFHTAALLGSALFYGLRDPAQLLIGPGPVLAYNGVHLIVFLFLGTVAAWLADLAERGPELWYVGAVVFIFMAFHMYGFFLMLTQPVRAALAPWWMLAAGALGCAAMGGYLLWIHPRIRSEIRHYPETT